MNRRDLLLFVALLGLLSSACATDLDELGEQRHALEGTWQVYAVETRHDCPDLGPLPPVEPGAITIARDGDGFIVTPRSGGESIVYSSVGPGEWSRSVTSPYEGCEIEADSHWTFDGVGQTQFSARFAGSVRVFGAECGYPESACAVGYTVTGMRLQGGGDR